MSLRARVLLGMAVIALVLAMSALVVTRSTRAHLTDQVDVQLREARPQIRDLLGGRGPGDPDGPTPRVSNLYVGALTRQGVLSTLHAPDLRGDTAPLPVVTLEDVTRLGAGSPITVSSTSNDSRYRLVAPLNSPRGTMLVLGLPLDDVDGAIGRLVVIEAIAVLSALAVLGLVTWWVIRLGVHPITRMTETAGAIAGGDLSQRVPVGTPGTEAGALGVALNGMLERIEEAFDQRAASEARLRQFVADASHELRTPVTTIRGYAEMFRTGALQNAGELSEAMRRTEQEAVRMGSLVQDLLRLARLDEGRPSELAPVDLAVVAADALRDALASSPNRQITLAAPASLVVMGNEDGLRQVVSNLVGNALVHAPESTVRIRLDAVDDRAVLEVADDGAGMAAADAARAFERFYRADASRSRQKGGSGLGLSIVDATVRAHGGTVAMTSELGAGTTVHVVLPISGPAVAPTPA